MNTADPRHYTLPKMNLYIDTESFIETGASPFLKLSTIVENLVVTINRDLNPNCRQCRYYEHEGRRGGYCTKLNVSVQGGWKACVLSEEFFFDSP